MMTNNLITLSSDFGNKDNYIGVMKGVILNINPNAKIIDITHMIPPQNIFSAGFILKSSFKYFPKHSLHVCVVDPSVGSDRKILFAECFNHFFLVPDNGILSILLKDKKPDRIISVTNNKFFLKEISTTFHGRDKFAPVAAHFSKGVIIDKFGKEIKSWVKLEKKPLKIIKNNTLEGKVIWIDSFGNIITDINKKDVSEKSIFLIKDKKIKGLSDTYCSKNDNEYLAIIGSFENLEISINKGNAAALLKVKIGDKVFVKV